MTLFCDENPKVGFLVWDFPAWMPFWEVNANRFARRQDTFKQKGQPGVRTALSVAG
jgi:hypothetical protein